MARQHGDHVFAIADDLAKRVCKIGGRMLHSIGERARRIKGIDDEFVAP